MRGVSAPMEFLIDLAEEVEEFAGDGRPYEFLHLAQRLARLQQVFIRYQGPSSETVEYPVAAFGIYVPARRAALAARSGRFPRRVGIGWCVVGALIPAPERAWSASGELAWTWPRSR